MVCYTPCMTNSNTYKNEYMKKRYAERKAKAIEFLGGHCINCGNTDRLEFDHVDPTKKLFSFSRIWSYAYTNFELELRKAQLLCYDCHKLKTSDDVGVVHGGGKSGKRNCSCEPCRKKKAEYMRQYRRTRGR